MIEFRIVMDAKFSAEDIDDAFLQLSLRFKAMADGDEPERQFLPASKIRIRPSEDFDEEESDGT